MFLSFDRPRRGFREDNDDLKRKKKKRKKGLDFVKVCILISGSKNDEKREENVDLYK